MPEHFDPLRAIQLAGTVSIPNPFPEPGRITLSRDRDVPFDGKCPTENCMFRIEHVRSNRLMIARCVWFNDIKAIYLADDPANNILPDDCEIRLDWRDKWLLPVSFDENCLKEFLSRFESHKEGLVGTVFVKEHASVLMEVQVGLTAAESAEYYPPKIYDFIEPFICH